MKNNTRICRYGLQQGFTVILNVVTTLIIGMIMRGLLCAVVFTILYIPLRSNAGGFHASSSGKCYIFSSLTMVAALLIVKYVDDVIVNCMFILFGLMICLIFAPVESKNKPLDIIEKSVYRKRTMLFLALILITLVLAFFLHIDMLFKTLSVVLLIEGTLLISRKII